MVREIVFGVWKRKEKGDGVDMCGFTPKDLWKVCNDYGIVVDVFIPNKKSKVGKHFAFVRFIKVINLDCLIENLNTIWIGRFHLFANFVRFERPKKLVFLTYKDMHAAPSNSMGFRQPKAQDYVGSYVNVVNGSSFVDVPGPYISSTSALVLDDSCVVERDLSKYAMGKVKDVNSIPNLRTLLMDEGFSDVKLMYLRGIPLNVWSRETFMRIGKKWGEMLDIEDNVDSSFGRRRLCIKTKQPLSILESFKIIFKGGMEFRWYFVCVEANIFKKAYATISNNFVAIYGTWLPSNSKILFLAIYAPQQASCKRVLWEYVSTLIGRWNGETIILGDFNEVRSIDERRGSCFNPSSARVFDHFISTSGLVDVKLEGYAFTWSHPVYSDFGLISFRFYHSWFSSEGFDAMVEQTWHSFSHSDVNRMILFKKKLQDLKAIIRCWVKDKRMHRSGEKNSIKNELNDIDKEVDRGVVSDTNIFRRLELQRHRGGRELKILPCIINKKRSQLAIREVFDNALWCTDSCKVKEAFFNYFEARFKKPVAHRFMLDFPFNKRLSDMQAADLERHVSRDEIRLAVWNCGENKSPGLDGYTLFSNGCNLSFVALIPKVADAKFVNDFRPISLIGSVYKVVMKILANRLALVIADLVSDTQSAKKKQAMFFKVDFAKEYDSIRWDYLLDVLEAFGFGQTWCKWIRSTFSFARASVLVNGSPSNEFSFHCGLKQCDPLSPYLFILIMESLHMSFSRAVDKGLFKGVHLQGSISISHLFYADDAMFIGEWSDANLKGVVNILQCFFLASGLKIIIHKSQVLGVGIPRSIVMQAASSIGCGVMHNQFRYLGVMVGECMSRHQAWDDTVLKLRSRLSNWKVKTLSIGGRLTLLKSVLGASPLYNMSIFKVPKGILKSMEAIRSNFFNEIDSTVKKITWAAWDKILASKENGGLGVSSFHALNRALLLKWVWRFISQDGSLWFRVIQGLYEPSIVSHPVNLSSNWCSIFRELHLLTDKDHYSPDMSMVGVGLVGSYVLFGLAELVFFYSSSV
nr:RNA-directed DNA polymerase, eukaryota [Tanacetum cinerariifolium]